MKLKITLLLTLFIWFAQPTQGQDFITEWTFPFASTQIRFYALTEDAPVNYTWSASPSGNSGNGSFIENSVGYVVLDGLNIPAGNVVTLSMTSHNLRRFYIDNGPDKARLTDVIQWGATPWSSMANAFHGCLNLNISATDIPNLSSVTDMYRMFRECNTLNSPSNINSWDTSSVTRMRDLFYNAYVFNQDLGNWNTSAVTDMWQLFRQSYAFNQDIGNWNTASVTSMYAMFDEAQAFNQDIGNWNTSSVSDMVYTFRNAISFNQDIGNWDTSAVTNMYATFYQASNFNHDISNWNITDVTDFGYMFFGASSFNQDISNWNTASITSMSAMFNFATSFNQDISNWNIDTVTELWRMFDGATSFNQNLGNWTLNPSAVMFSMFDDSGMDCDNYSATLVGWETNNPDVTNRDLDALGRVYGTSAEAARTVLINERGWTISGDTASNEACDALLSVDDVDVNVLNLVVIYPNPSFKEFTLKFNSIQQKITVEVFNVKGQLVLNQHFDNTDLITINITGGSGVYFTNISNGQHSQMQKLIKI